MNWKKRALVAIAGFAVGVGLALPRAGAAVDREYNAGFCYEGSPGTYSDPGTLTGPNIWGAIQNWDTGNAAFLFCPVNSDTLLYEGNITGVDVYVQDNNTNAGQTVVVNLCVTYIGSSGGACNSTASSSADGWQTVSPTAPGVWGSPGGWAYLYMTVPRKSGTNPSMVLGYRTHS